MGEDNVMPIGEARRRRAKSAPKEEKLSQAMVCQALANAVAGEPIPGAPPFPDRYLVLSPKPGVKIPLTHETDDSVAVCLPSAVSDSILNYCNNELRPFDAFTIKPQLAKEARDYFLATAAPVPHESLKFVRWADEPGLTYRRLPWIRVFGDCPTWEHLLSRMSNNQAFMEWVGSLFFDEAHTHNYLWIYGEGGDGKGAINRFFERVFGGSYRSKSAPGTDKNGVVDKFWAFNLLGAKLVAFPDCENPSFVTTGFFKSLTGGDPLELEPKGGQSFTAKLQSRYMILANCKPAVTSAKSDTRRIIYCEMEPTTDYDPKFEDALWSEGGAFISLCVGLYEQKYLPNHGPIVSDESSLRDVIDDNEQHLENFFNEYFELTPDGYASGKEIKMAAEEAWPRSRKIYQAFLLWIKRIHGISQERVAGTGERRYPGMGRRRVVLLNKSSIGCDS